MDENKNIHFLGKKIGKIASNVLERKTVDDEINKVFTDTARSSKQRKSCYTEKIRKNKYIVAEKNILKAKHKKSRYWHEIVDQISEIQGNKDVVLAAANRIYEIGMKITDDGHVQGLTYFLDNVLIRENPYDLPEDLQGIETKLDKLESINDMAARIIFYVTNNVITFKTAEKLLGLLERKVSLIETGAVLKDLEKLKELAHNGGFLSTQNFFETGMPARKLEPVPEDPSEEDLEVCKPKRGRPAKSTPPLLKTVRPPAKKNVADQRKRGRPPRHDKNN